MSTTIDDTGTFRCGNNDDLPMGIYIDDPHPDRCSTAMPERPLDLRPMTLSESLRQGSVSPTTFFHIRDDTPITFPGSGSVSAIAATPFHIRGGTYVPTMPEVLLAVQSMTAEERKRLSDEIAWLNAPVAMPVSLSFTGNNPPISTGVLGPTSCAPIPVPQPES